MPSITAYEMFESWGRPSRFSVTSTPLWLAPAKAKASARSIVRATLSHGPRRPHGPATQRAACTIGNHVLCWRRGGGGRPQGEGVGGGSADHGRTRGVRGCAHRAARGLARAPRRRLGRDGRRRRGASSSPLTPTRPPQGPRAGRVRDRRGAAPAPDACPLGVGSHARRRTPARRSLGQPPGGVTAEPRGLSVDPTAIKAWAAAVYEVGPALEVTGVQPKSVAERAGLQIGDAVVTINGLTPDFHTLDGNLAHERAVSAPGVPRRAHRRHRPQARAPVAPSDRRRSHLRATPHHGARARAAGRQGDGRVGGARARARLHRHVDCR